LASVGKVSLWHLWVHWRRLYSVLLGWGEGDGGHGSGYILMRKRAVHLHLS